MCSWKYAHSKQFAKMLFDSFVLLVHPHLPPIKSNNWENGIEWESGSVRAVCRRLRKPSVMVERKMNEYEQAKKKWTQQQCKSVAKNVFFFLCDSISCFVYALIPFVIQWKGFFSPRHRRKTLCVARFFSLLLFSLFLSFVLSFSYSW